ncbi:hypothetical protein [Anabaena azotica]|uniref:hypothetical protein n=1 Tax=Anabaena azotica TaxID=197653 RepID=UPI0039A6D711
MNLGNKLFLENKWQQAIYQYEKIIHTELASAIIYYQLSQCYRNINNSEKSFQIMQTGIKNHPTNAQLHFDLIINLCYSGCNQEAIASAEKACQLIPNDYTFKILKYLTVPTIYEDESEILPYRQRYIQGLEKLIKETSLSTPKECQNTLAATSRLTNFYLSYQANNDVDLQSQYGQLLHQIMAANFPQWFAPLSMQKLQHQEKIRKNRLFDDQVCVRGVEFFI